MRMPTSLSGARTVSEIFIKTHVRGQGEPKGVDLVLICTTFESEP